jgi:hypothetical protein
MAVDSRNHEKGGELAANGFGEVPTAIEHTVVPGLVDGVVLAELPCFGVPEQPVRGRRMAIAIPSSGLDWILRFSQQG